MSIIFSSFSRFHSFFLLCLSATFSSFYLFLSYVSHLVFSATLTPSPTNFFLHIYSLSFSSLSWLSSLYTIFFLFFKILLLPLFSLVFFLLFLSFLLCFDYVNFYFSSPTSLSLFNLSLLFILTGHSLYFSSTCSLYFACSLPHSLLLFLSLHPIDECGYKFRNVSSISFHVRIKQAFQYKFNFQLQCSFN